MKDQTPKSVTTINLDCPLGWFVLISQMKLFLLYFAVVRTPVNTAAKIEIKYG